MPGTRLPNRHWHEEKLPCRLKTCTYHINAISKKISSSIGSIKRISHCLPPATLHNIYHGLVQSHFNYCSVVWGNCAKTLSDKLQRLQNRTHSSYDADTIQLFKELVLEWPCTQLFVLEIHSAERCDYFLQFA